MPTEIELSVASMFSDAVSQSIALELRTPADWARYDEIKKSAKQRTKKEVDRFEHNRPELLAAARKDLIDKAGAKTFEHPTPFGIDRFAKAEIERQAVTKIFGDHTSALMQIKSREVDAYETLRDEIHTREGVRDLARDGFNRATDQRGIGDRQLPSRDR